MSDPAVIIEQHGAVAVVRFDRRGRGNALTFPIMTALTEAATSLANDPSVAAVVLTGAPAIFTAGMDLRQDEWERLEQMPLEERRLLTQFGPKLVRAFHALEVPTIAAIEGICFGGGVALTAFCDFRVAASDARLAAPEVAVGLNMTWHSVPRLVRLVGAQATRRLLLTATEWTAAEAQRLGFVDEIAEPGGALSRAMEMAAQMAARPRLATRLVKRAIEAASHGGDTLHSLADSDLLLVTSMSEDFRAGRARLIARGRLAKPKGETP